MNKDIRNYWISKGKFIESALDLSTRENIDNECEFFFFYKDKNRDLVIIAEERIYNGKKEIYYSFGNGKYFDEFMFLKMIKLSAFV